MGEERNFEFFIGDCQLPAVVSPESTIWLLPADSNEEEVSGSIKRYVDKAAESGDRMPSCRYVSSPLMLNAVKAQTNCCSKSSTATESGKPLNALIMNG